VPNAKAPPPQTIEDVLSAVSAERLCRRDPVARALLRLTPRGPWSTFRLGVIVHVLGIIVAGLVIDRVYGCGPALQPGAADFVCRSNGWILTPDVLGYGVTYSLVWAFYAWQPLRMAAVLRNLHSNGVIGAARSAPLRPMPILRRWFDRPLGAIVVTASALFCLVSWHGALGQPNNKFFLGGKTMWFLVNPYYHWIVFAPLVFLMLYMMGWIVLRGIAYTQILRWLFETFEIKPVIHHRDGCNGFAAVGDVAVRTGLLAVLSAFWVVFFIGYPRLWGEAPNWGPDTIVLLALYVVGTPLVVAGGMWAAHRALVEAKHRTLEEEGAQIRRVLAEKDPAKIAESAGLLDELQSRYDLKRRDIRVWPVQNWDLGRFVSGFVTSPYFSWAITTGLAEWYK
jgi:hypothetical protein